MVSHRCAAETARNNSGRRTPALQPPFKSERRGNNAIALNETVTPHIPVPATRGTARLSNPATKPLSNYQIIRRNGAVVLEPNKIAIADDEGLPGRAWYAGRGLGQRA